MSPALLLARSYGVTALVLWFGFTFDSWTAVVIGMNLALWWPIKLSVCHDSIGAAAPPAVAAAALLLIVLVLEDPSGNTFLMSLASVGAFYAMLLFATARLDRIDRKARP